MVDLGFLSASRREREVFDGVLRLLDEVSKTVSSFEECVLAMAEGDTRGAAEQVRKVIEEETAADGIHRDLSLRIAEGAFFGGVREDILNLLEKVDNIADSAKDAARALSSDPRLGVEAKEVLGAPEMKEFLAELRSSVAALADLVRSLEKGKGEALAKVKPVEDHEEEADSLKDAMIRDLFTTTRQMSPVTVIQLRDFMFIADNVADNAEDASDVILVLIAKGYG